jgi:phage shock protein PspC (stress-responsive transcriptional regulator)
MKEITRIHIAKVAYDIELDAKKDIQKYIAALERYANDAEILDDIEIRITELLAERGVVAGGVVSRSDVAAVRVQLGEPTDFIPEGEGDLAVGGMEGRTRRLYRDRDSAIVGGVLAGIARFFRIDPVWTRLLFIVALIVSAGAVGIVYLVMWLVVPPARTAAEKLQMRGESVALDDIKRMSEQDDVEDFAAATMRRIIRFGVGSLLVLGATGALVVTAYATLGLIFGTTDNSPIASWRPSEVWWVALALGLCALAGLLLSALGFILADATFRKRWNRRIGTGVVVVSALGIISFMGGVGTMMYGSWQESVRYESLRKTSTVALPSGFMGVKQVTITGYVGDQPLDAVSIEYIVSDKPRYELDAQPGIKPQITISADGAESNITIRQTGYQARPFWGNSYVSLKIYGPALEGIAARNSQNVHYTSYDTQDTLAIIGESSEIGLSGSYQTVQVTSRGNGATISLDDAAIEDLKATLDAGRITAGVVRTLAVNIRDSCSSNDSGDNRGELAVQAVSSGQTSINGSQQKAGSVVANCGRISIGPKDCSYDDVDARGCGRENQD